MSEFARMELRSGRLTAGPFYTVVNRTSRVLTVTVDGVCFKMQPGLNPDVPSAVAQYCERQHPRRGTFDETMQHGESLLVVKELCAEPARMSLIPPGREHLGDEMIDRREFPHDNPVQLERVARPANYDESPFGSEEPGAIVLEADR
jgi:hypothetical protein